MKLLYFAQESSGGLLPYVQDQAHALTRQGADVTVLCSPLFSKREGDGYNLKPKLIREKHSARASWLVRRATFAFRYLKNARMLAQEIKRGRYDAVLLSSYAEYLSPFWSGQFADLASRGQVFGAVVQEPVRDFVVGPLWWHRLSVRKAYDYLSVAFTHDEVRLDTCGSRADIAHRVIPYGCHRFPEPTRSRHDVRKELGIPENAPLLFSFGVIRDGKNLDFTIRALKHLPEVHFLVAGRRSAGTQKPEDYYVDLARQYGVEDRCRWKFAYVSEEDAANYFLASDIAMLTYSSDFRSASSALNVAARYKRPVIASAGQGSMQSVVKKYNLGVWVKPDESDAVLGGIRKWLADGIKPDWEAYEADNSWDRNAVIILQELAAAKNRQQQKR